MESSPCPASVPAATWRRVRPSSVSFSRSIGSTACPSRRMISFARTVTTCGTTVLRAWSRAVFVASISIALVRRDEPHHEVSGQLAVGLGQVGGDVRARCLLDSLELALADGTALRRLHHGAGGRRDRVPARAGHARDQGRLRLGQPWRDALDGGRHLGRIDAAGRLLGEHVRHGFGEPVERVELLGGDVRARPDGGVDRRHRLRRRLASLLGGDRGLVGPRLGCAHVGLRHVTDRDVDLRATDADGEHREQREGEERDDERGAQDRRPPWPAGLELGERARDEGAGAAAAARTAHGRAAQPAASARRRLTVSLTARPSARPRVFALSAPITRPMSAGDPAPCPRSPGARGPPSRRRRAAAAGTR